MAYGVPGSYSSGQSFVDLFADTLSGFDSEPHFEVFDPRGLFASASAPCELPLSPTPSSSKLAGKSDDAKLREELGNGLPALRIPGMERRTDHDKGFTELDLFNRRYQGEAGVDDNMCVPGLARSASNEALSPMDSVPGTPASTVMQLHQPLIEASPSMMGASPKPRGRTELRRILLDAQYTTSQSPSRRLHTDQDLTESALFSNFNPASETNPRRRRIEQSPGAESIGSDAYSDMVMSPAVSFLSAFAESTNAAAAAFVPVDELEGESSQGDEVAGYELGPVVGKGTYSVVREGTRLIDGVKVAVKIIPNALDACSSVPDLVSLSRVQTRKDSALGNQFAFRDRSCSTPAPVTSLFKSTPDPLASSLSSLTGQPPACASKEFLERELAIWSQVGCHPNILPMLGVHRGPKRTYVFMPLCASGNLLQLLNETGCRSLRRRNTKPATKSRPMHSMTSHDHSASISKGLDIPHARHIFAQIVKGVEYLHLQAGVVHKDLKLENILVDEGVFRIADFGLAHAISLEMEQSGVSLAGAKEESLALEGRPSLPRIREASWPGAENSEGPRTDILMMPIRPGMIPEGLPSFAQVMPVPANYLAPAYDVAAGSLPYTTPEQLRSASPIFNPSADIWALGCILYALLDGQLPFHDDYEPRLRMKILKAEWETPKILLNKSVGESRAAEAVLRGCLDPDPHQRWTIQQIADSDWLSGDTERRGRSRYRMHLRRLGSYGNYGQVDQGDLETSTSPSRSRSKSRNKFGQAMLKQLCLDGTEGPTTPTCPSPSFPTSSPLDSPTGYGILGSPHSPNANSNGSTTQGYLRRTSLERRGRSRDRRTPVGTLVTGGHAATTVSGHERRSAISPSHSRSASHKRASFR